MKSPNKSLSMFFFSGTVDVGDVFTFNVGCDGFGFIRGGGIFDGISLNAEKSN